MLQIHSPREYSTPNQRPLIPTLDTSIVDITPIENLATEVIEMENNKLDNIEANYNALADEKDKLLGASIGYKDGRERFQGLKSKFGIEDEDEFFNLSMEELNDPFIIRDKQSSVTALMNNVETQEILEENAYLQDFERELGRLERKDPAMARVAKKHFVDVKNSVPLEDGSILQPSSLNSEDYQRINFTDLMVEELDEIGENISIEEDPNSLEGLIILNEIGEPVLSEQQFIDRVVEKYGDSQVVRNNLLAQVDPNKPASEQHLNDPEAIDAFLTEQARKAFKTYGRRTKGTTVKEDKAGLIRLKGEVKKEQEDRRLRNIRENKKGIPKGDTEVYGKPTNSAVFDTDTYGDYSSSIGNRWLQQGYNVEGEDLFNLKKAYDEFEGLVQRRIDPNTGAIQYVVPNDLGEMTIVAEFEKMPKPEGFIGSALDLQHINGNRILRDASLDTKNLVQTYLNNPLVYDKAKQLQVPLQDAFFDEVLLPRYNKTIKEILDDEELKQMADELGVTGNKLYYLIHHNGPDGAKRWLKNKGELGVRLNPNSDGELMKGWGRAEKQFGENWDNVPAEEYLKYIESLNDPQAIYKGQDPEINSTAFGAYQFTIGNLGNELRQFAAEKLGSGFNLGKGGISNNSSTSSSSSSSSQTSQQFRNAFGGGSKAAPTEGNATDADLTGSEFSDIGVQNSSEEPTVYNSIKTGIRNESSQIISQLRQKRSELEQANTYGDDMSEAYSTINQDIQDITLFREMSEDAINDVQGRIISAETTPGKPLNLFPSERKFGVDATITASNTKPTVYRLELDGEVLEDLSEEQVYEAVRGKLNVERYEEYNLLKYKLDKLERLKQHEIDSKSTINSTYDSKKERKRIEESYQERIGDYEGLGVKFNLELDKLKKDKDNVGKFVEFKFGDNAGKYPVRYTEEGLFEVENLEGELEQFTERGLKNFLMNYLDNYYTDNLLKPNDKKTVRHMKEYELGMFEYIRDRLESDINELTSSEMTDEDRRTYEKLNGKRQVFNKMFETGEKIYTKLDNALTNKKLYAVGNPVQLYNKEEHGADIEIVSESIDPPIYKLTVNGKVHKGLSKAKLYQYVGRQADLLDLE